MRLKSARVVGFQSFSDSRDIEFVEGINLIVGQNNSGKSALLRALLPDLADERHRSPERWEDFRLPVPVTHLSIEITGNEIAGVLFSSGHYSLPVPSEGDKKTWIEGLVAKPSVLIKGKNTSKGQFLTDYPGHGEFVWTAGWPKAFAGVNVENGELAVSVSAGDDDSGRVAMELWRSKMFYFSAERIGIGEAPQAYAARLLPNASNLPNVLQMLAGDRGTLFDRLVGHLREIFATVGNLSVRPRPNTNYIEVRVWPTEAREHVELSFPLTSSGTGVSQVIALLTAIMTIENAVIIIDEINSFLHPAAVKALLRILQTEYTQHQYIISTHAPEVIGFSNPRTIHLVKRSGYESSVKALELEHIDQFREIADHLGISMADVFAAERVIWVEGPTEELCFPLLYTYATGEPLPRGTIFTSVVAPGDFGAKKRDQGLLYRIYTRLSTATTPLVQSVLFSFDSEKLNEREIKDIIRESKGAVRFLPRRHIECFLINAEAIAIFINDRDLEAEQPIRADAVAEHLSKLAAERRYLVKEWNKDIADVAWHGKVDAAKLINATCADLSDGRVTFRKKDETLALLKLVMEVAPEQVVPLANYAKGLVEAVGSR